MCHDELFDVMTYFWRHDELLTSLRIFNFMTYLWRHHDLLESWRTFWRYDVLWRHDVTFTSWRFLGVMRIFGVLFLHSVFILFMLYNLYWHVDIVAKCEVFSQVNESNIIADMFIKKSNTKMHRHVYEESNASYTRQIYRVGDTAQPNISLDT